MIYYFRQPDKNKEYYELYSNSHLSKVGERLESSTEDYNTIVWAVKYYNGIE